MNLVIGVTLAKHGPCHLLDHRGVVPTLRSIRHTALRAPSLQLPGDLAETLLIELACCDFRDAIKIVESDTDVASGKNGVGMQVVLKAPFIGENGSASRASIDGFRSLPPEFGLRRQFMIVKMEFRSLQRSQAIGPCTHMAAAEGNKDQLATLFHFNKIGQALVIRVQQERDPTQEFDVVGSLNNEQDLYGVC